MSPSMKKYFNQELWLEKSMSALNAKETSAFTLFRAWWVSPILSNDVWISARRERIVNK